MYRLFIRAVTWQRDSHGLFDYESKTSDRLQNEFRTSSSVTVMRKGTSGAVSLENPKK